MTENKLLNYFTDHAQTVFKPTHISGSQIDHVEIRKTSLEEFSTKVTLESIYFSDHDNVRLSFIASSAMSIHQFHRSSI